MIKLIKLRSAQQNLPAVPIPTDLQLPIQASGIRRSKALPYELHTSARCQTDGTVKLIFSNTGTQGAVFHVYDKLNLSRIPRRYIEAGKSLDDIWNVKSDNQGLYDLWVLGPNGFHRHFKGDTSRLSDLQINPEIRVCYDIANGDIYVDLINSSTQDLEFVLTPVVYRTDAPLKVMVKAGQTTVQHWQLKDSGNGMILQ